MARRRDGDRDREGRLDSLIQTLAQSDSNVLYQQSSDRIHSTSGIPIHRVLAAGSKNNFEIRVHEFSLQNARSHIPQWVWAVLIVLAVLVVFLGGGIVFLVLEPFVVQTWHQLRSHAHAMPTTAT
jgi:hypothetical protein